MHLLESEQLDDQLAGLKVLKSLAYVDSTRLVVAGCGINIPVFLFQPPKDTSLEPSRVLGAEFRRLGKQYVGKIYPPDLPEPLQVHCFGGAKGMHVWKEDVLAFLADKVR